ncbi:MAG: lysozyme inhibitor LprI family protein [Granulosicoccus sp.]
MSMSTRAVTAVISILFLSLACRAEAQDYNVLEECSSRSQDIDEIHTCLDSYLDVMDGNIRAITEFLAETLSGKALAGLNRSQSAFVEYRRQNCLWYLDFSSPRNEAEQIAKNCLAHMSQQRLEELQNLVTADDSTGVALRGFYVYGADRNSFQPCGSDDRYWVEGDNVAVSRVQQSYLSVATSELQLLHAVFVGEVNTELQAPAGHTGIFEVTNLIELRVPTDSDCQLPSAGSSTADTLPTQVSPTELAREVSDDEQPGDQDEPEQQLTAYFGAWLVDCVEFNGQKMCELQSALSEDGKESTLLEEGGSPRVVINRTPRNSTFIEVFFPDREIDSVARIHWEVDSTTFGDIVDSDIRVDESGTLQIVKESDFLTSELLPSMIKGIQLKVDVLASVNHYSGDQFTSTLLGLTKAMTFADDFVESDG